MKENVASGILPFALKSLVRFPMLFPGQGLVVWAFFTIFLLEDLVVLEVL